MILFMEITDLYEHLKKKFIFEAEERLEEAIEIYAITKGILSGRIIPKTT